MDNATFEENFVITYPPCALQAANSDLALPRKIENPHRTVPLQSRSLIVEHSFYTGFASRRLKKQTGFKGKRLSVIKSDIGRADY